MRILRFVYLNSYAFFLLFLGMVIVLVPTESLIIIIKSIAVLFCIVSSFSMFFSWKKKKRIMAVLRGRNRKEFRPDTFKRQMMTFCGRLLVKSVLRDLRKSNAYSSLSSDEWKAYREKLFNCKNLRREMCETN
jgi:hypothetical protein